MKPLIVPKYDTVGYDGNNLDELIRSGKLCRSDIAWQESLETDWSPSTPLYVQYTLVDNQGRQTLSCPRINEDALENPDAFSEAEVLMSFLILEMDMKDNGKKRPWASGEFARWFLKAANSHPILDAGVVYSTPHGARIMFRLSESVPVNSEGWRLFYREFAKQFEGFGPNNESIDLNCDSWNDLFRVPKSDRFQGEVMYGSNFRAGLAISREQRTLLFSKSETVSKVANGGLTFEPSPGDSSNVIEIKTALTRAAQASRLSLEKLSETSIFKWAELNAEKLSYTMWWAIGTNIFAAADGIPDEGLQAWHTFSALDTARYDAGTVDKEWKSIQRYFKRGRGPVTFKKMKDYLGSDWDKIYPQGSDIPRPSGSIAGLASKRAFRSIDVSIKPVDDGPLPPDKIWHLLSKKLVGPKDAKKEVVIGAQAPHNLRLILSRDAHFYHRLRTNLLGVVEEWEDPTSRGIRTINEPDTLSDVRDYISRTYQVDFGDKLTVQHFRAECYRYRYHPVQDYLYTLEWDGQCRIDDFLRGMGADLNDYHRMVARKWLIAAVVRPLQIKTTRVRDYSYLDDGKRIPMKVDEMIVLQGEQGAGDYGGKSEFWRSLVPQRDWFSDKLPHITKQYKDAQLHCLGAWILEMAEFEEYKSKANDAALKRWLSSDAEKYRRQYEVGENLWPRSCVFVGTVNQEKFLTDMTGSRRYYVIPVGKLDVPFIRGIRDQLWAQAVHLFESGETWWLRSHEKNEQKAHNTQFEVVDAHEEYILDWIGQTNPKYLDTRGRFGKPHMEYIGGFTSLDIASQALGKFLGTATNYDLQKIGMVLRKNGYTKHRIMIDGAAKKVYIKV